jgi:hypothetical protein
LNNDLLEKIQHRIRVSKGLVPIVSLSQKLNLMRRKKDRFEQSGAEWVCTLLNRPQYAVCGYGAGKAPGYGH